MVDSIGHRLLHAQKTVPRKFLIAGLSVAHLLVESATVLLEA